MKPFALMLFTALVIATSPAAAQGCKLDGTVFDCGKGKPDAILKAFAAPETGEALSEPLENLNNFKRPRDIETFRRSLARNWRAVNRAERAERRKMRRRRISAAQFSDWSKLYDAALANYRIAITFYRTLVWHGKTGKAPPES